MIALGIRHPRSARAGGPPWERGASFLTWLFLLFLGALAACGDGAAQSHGGGAFQPTDALLLSTNSPTKDEDPSVLRARDGTLFVAWFSDRGGNSDIYITSTSNGRDWSPLGPPVTASSAGDFYPTLFQDEQGTFHLTWFRWTAPFLGHIWYNTSTDGLTWNPASEVQVTTDAGVDDWVPSITQAADGTLLIYFVSRLRRALSPTNDIYVATKRPAQTTWDPPVPVAGINSATEHDHLPFAARTGATITLVWDRYDTTKVIPWENPKSDLWYATSSNGLSWSPPAKITNDVGNVVHLYPGLFPSLTGEWSLVWLSTKLGPPLVFELPLANAGMYPLGLTQNTLLPAGYSHRIAATSSPGVYLGVWVQGPDGAQDIYYRFFEK
jgi:hypothetical protein